VKSWKQNPLTPKVFPNPYHAAISGFAQESFHGASGMYDFAEPPDAVFVLFQ
jgi:hypothetical protein